MGDKEFIEPDYQDILFIEEKMGDTNVGVPARLLGKQAFYLEVGASQYIVDSVESGYKLIFCDEQPPPKNFQK